MDMHAQKIKDIDVPCWVKRLAFQLKGWNLSKKLAGQSIPGTLRFEIENLIWQYYRNNPIYSALKEHEDMKELEKLYAGEIALSDDEDIEDRIGPILTKVTEAAWMFQMKTLVHPSETLLHRPDSVECSGDSKCECFLVPLETRKLKTVFQFDKVVCIDNIGTLRVWTVVFKRVADSESIKRRTHSNLDSIQMNAESGDKKLVGSISKTQVEGKDRVESTATTPCEPVAETPLPILMILPGATKKDVDFAYENFSKRVNQQLGFDFKHRQNNFLGDFMVHFLRKKCSPAETKEKLKKLTGLAWEQNSQGIGLERFESDSRDKVPYIFSNWINQFY